MTIQADIAVEQEYRIYKNTRKQAGAELCQAQASYPIKVVAFGKLRAL